MEITRVGLLLIVSTLAACAPPSHTGDPDVDAIIDLVVDREAPFHGCLQVTNEGGLVADFPADYSAPLGSGWDVDQFDDPKVVDAARRIAVSLDEAIRMEHESRVLHLFGGRDPNSDGCIMSVTRPTFSGDYAFLHFMNPGGGVGNYAMLRSGSAWRVKERVDLGFW